MRSLPKPDFSAAEVFGACCSGISDDGRRVRLTANAELVERAARDFRQAGLAGEHDQFGVDSYLYLGGAEGGDFKWAYEKRLVSSVPARPYYDRLMHGNFGRMCALCGARTARTLDHYLPKAKFPVLAVTPDNLLPACFECNHAKSDASGEMLNGYFDELGDGEWLQAEVVESFPVMVNFSIDVREIPDAQVAKRAESHFVSLNLARIYGEEAARTLAGFRRLLEKILKIGGMSSVREHLEYSAESWMLESPNSWEAACYRAAAESTWFCAGGFVPSAGV